MVAKNVLEVKWIDAHREPKEKPNPDYPNGIDIDVSNGAAETCFVSLPYPAERCGCYVIKCPSCGATAMVTTAGRPDDPRSLKIDCKEH